MIRTPYSPLVETCNITAYSLLVFLFSSSGYRLSSVLASPLNPTCLLGYCSICSRGTQLKLRDCWIVGKSGIKKERREKSRRRKVMRLHLLLAKVKPEQITAPSHCVDPQCPGQKFRLHQPVKKALRDTVYHEVQVYRYQCLKCKRTFRVYPPGVTAAQTSLRVKGLAVMLYLLGLSYGATSLALEALGVSMCRSRVYDAVQEAASRV